MNLKDLSDEILDQRTIQSVKDETESTLRVLHHLREVDRRRLFSKLKYESLQDYAERRLRYPYDQAWRRIEAMRLIKEIPEAEEKIANGTLNLTSVGYARAAFKAVAKKDSALNHDEKLQFLERIENKSTRAVQKIIAEEFGTTICIKETVKPVSKDISLLSIPVSDALLAKIEKLKGLLAHSHPGMSTADAIEQALDALIEQSENKRQSKVAAPRKPKLLAPSENPNSRYIPASENRTLWNSANSKCSNCGSTYALERDHRQAFAKGGNSQAKNLRILCRNCNQRAAIETYGQQKMELYLRSPSIAYLH